MQTFLPYPSYELSAKCLDYRRLGKQRVECLQLLQALDNGPLTKDGKKTPWYFHPAAQLWKNHKKELALYGIEICKEWISRGYKDTCLGKIEEKMQKYIDNGPPLWLGNDRFHSSHRAALLYKKFDWYKQFGWSEQPDIPNEDGKLNYYWLWQRY